MECFPLVVQVLSGRPTRHRATFLPIFLWLSPTFSSAWIVGFCLLHRSENIMVWNINFLFLAANKKF